MADLLQISKSQLNRKVLEQTGYTPSKLILKHRIELAQQQLIFTSNSIELVALNSGFQNLSSFSRKFKQENSCSPSKYRTKNSYNGINSLNWTLPFTQTLIDQIIFLKKKIIGFKSFLLS